QMGLDVYAGSFTRYYAGNWETVVQKFGREGNIPVVVVRANEPADAITDPEVIRPAILSWRDQLSQALGANITTPLDWDESDRAPYFTDKPAWDSYSSLLLWAAYSEHPTLPRPQDCVEDWTTDPAFRRSADLNFKTEFSQLLRGVEIWLPHDFSFTFRAADPVQNAVCFGSSVALCEQLDELNRRTWNAEEATLAQWRWDGAEPRAPLETGARFAFSIMAELSREAVTHHLILKLDY
ncbi:MAG TPA: hypothetical protein VEI07_02660, partial [Planctomycetaceae bacterium]|nr:hypothetical protein [Planctomycetaceae bacterium]